MTLKAITPYLEPTAAGLSTRWAQETAKRLQCIVIVGYPEIETPQKSISQLDKADPAVDNGAGGTHSAKRYNSTVTISPTGEVISHYRKSFLYFADVPWASEGQGFHVGTLPFQLVKGDAAKSTTQTAHGICMDINPYAFIAPFNIYEFANHALKADASLVILSMAWSHQLLTHGDLQGEAGKQVELGTLGYWIERFRPLVEKRGKETVLVMANRCGTERDGEDGAGTVFYAGSSTVMKVGNGKVESWGFLGKSEEGLLAVDTGEAPGLTVTSDEEYVVGGELPDTRIIEKPKIVS